jgi:ComF family protein
MLSVPSQTNPIRLWAQLSDIASACIDTAFPPLCTACREYNDNYPDLCPACDRRVQITDTPACLNCHTPWLDCGRRIKCCESPLPLFSYGHYESPLREMVLDLKFHGMTSLADILIGRLIVVHPELKKELEGVILVPIPLHTSHERIRGYNQAALLAECLVKTCHASINEDIIWRFEKRHQQAKLSLEMRATNVTGAFALSEVSDDKSKKIVIVDDVVTSGATVREVARILRAGGWKVTAVVSAASNYLW